MNWGLLWAAPLAALLATTGALLIAGPIQNWFFAKERRVALAIIAIWPIFFGLAGLSYLPIWWVLDH